MFEFRTTPTCEVHSGRWIIGEEQVSMKLNKEIII